MKILISDLWVLQNGLRNHAQVERMAEFVREGGKFTFDARLAQHLLTEKKRATPPPMHISIMEDGRLMLHDGHHRAVAMFLSGREIIHESEYESGHYTYEDYIHARPERGWYTPFDVNTEVRLPDFGLFKAKAKTLYKLHGTDRVTAFIEANRNSYSEPRRIKTVAELAQQYLRHHEGTLCQTTTANCAAAS